MPVTCIYNQKNFIMFHKVKQAWRRLRKRYRCADVSDQPGGTFREINEQAPAVSDGMYKNSGVKEAAGLISR